MLVMPITQILQEEKEKTCSLYICQVIDSLTSIFASGIVVQ